MLKHVVQPFQEAVSDQYVHGFFEVAQGPAANVAVFLQACAIDEEHYCFEQASLASFDHLGHALKFTNPPSIGSVMPVTQRDSSEAR